MNYKFFNKFNKIIASLLISVFFCCSCTSYKAIREDTNDFRISLVAGDEIKVTKSDGKVLRLRYVEITDEILITQYFNIPLDQITKIEKRKFSVLKTTGLIIGVPLLIIGVGFVALVIWVIIADPQIGG